MKNQTSGIVNSPYRFLFNVKFSHKDTKLPYSLEEFKSFQKFHVDKSSLKRFSTVLTNVYSSNIQCKKDAIISYFPTPQKKQRLFSAETDGNTPTLSPTDPINITNSNLLITAIESSIKKAQSQNPLLVTLLAPLLRALDGIKNTMPNPSEDDLNTLYNLATLPDAATLSGYLTEDEQTEYRATIAQAFQKMLRNLLDAQDSTNNNISAKEDLLNFFKSTQSNILNMINEASNLLASGSDKHYAQTTTSALTIESLYITIGESYPRLSADEQTAILSNLSTLLSTGITLKNGIVPTRNVGQVIAAMSVYQETELYLITNPNAKTSDLKNYLLNVVAPRIRTYPLGSTIASGFTTVVNGYFDNVIVKTNGGIATLIAEFPAKAMKEAFQSGSADGSGFQGFSNLEQIYTMVFTTSNTQKNQEINDLNLYYDSLDPANALFLSQMQSCQTQLIETQNLGEAFIRMILDTYLPQQNSFLDPLIKVINFNNIGAGILNKIIKITNTFSSSGVYYNFSSYLSQSKEGKDLFSGDFAKTIVANVDERQRILDDLSRTQQAQNQIKIALTEIEGMSELTDFEKQNMNLVFQNYQYFFLTIEKQLMNLHSLLANLKITPEKTNTYKILSDYPDWMSLLSNLEGAVISGYGTLTPPGGLSNIFTQVQSDQQSYTNQSQTQQLNLQNQMTTIQQEWTIISTSLQIFNQILVKLANKIFE